jgi:hypothetical protein
MEQFDISSWPEAMRPDWFHIVIDRATCPQGCKTTDQARIWEEHAISLIKNDPYAVSSLSKECVLAVYRSC